MPQQRQEAWATRSLKTLNQTPAFRVQGSRADDNFNQTPRCPNNPKPALVADVMGLKGSLDLGFQIQVEVEGLRFFCPCYNAAVLWNLCLGWQLTILKLGSSRVLRALDAKPRGAKEPLLQRSNG